MKPEEGQQRTAQYCIERLERACRGTSVCPGKRGGECDPQRESVLSRVHGKWDERHEAEHQVHDGLTEGRANGRSAFRLLRRREVPQRPDGGVDQPHMRRLGWPTGS